MAVERERFSLRKKLLNTEIKSMLGPCMITFAIPLFVPGLTITLVAFSDETGFSKYGPLHILGIIILTIACLLLVLGCVLRFACKSKVHPVTMPVHRVTTHERPKALGGRTLTKDRLPPLNHGPMPGGSAVPRDHIPGKEKAPTTNHVGTTETAESDSDDVTDSSSDSEEDTPSEHRLPENSPGDSVNNNNKQVSKHSSPPVIGTAILVENGDVQRSQNSLDSQKDDHPPKTSFYLEDERLTQRESLMCPSYTDMRHSDDVRDDSDSEYRMDGIGYPRCSSVENPIPKTGVGWVSREPEDGITGFTRTESRPNTSGSASSCDVSDGEAGDDDDVTLTEASRNCSTIPEIADLDRDETVEEDRFQNVWRGDSQNSVEISSVLSQDEYSEESLSVVSKDQLEIVDPVGSRGRTSTDSAMESEGDHSRAVSQRLFERREMSSELREGEM